MAVNYDTDRTVLVVPDKSVGKAMIVTYNPGKED